MSKTREVRLILGDQLNPHHTWFASAEESVLFLMMEIREETDYVTHHVQKVMAFFLAMRHFAKWLKERGHQVLYIALDDPSNAQTLEGNLSAALDHWGTTNWSCMEPDEYRVEVILSDLRKRLGVGRVVNSEHFLTERGDVAAMFDGKKTFLMERFYREMRKRHRVLLDAGGEPVGGKWNFDAENRGKWPKSHVPPQPIEFPRDPNEWVVLLEAQGVQTCGRATAFGWPVTRDEALETVTHFVSELLPQFGLLQDAMTTEGWALYHSRLSFALNVKLVHPMEVIRAVERAYLSDPERIPLSSAEGFIRQILGWREYVRGIYWAHMPAYASLNYFGSDRALPSWFWTGKTHMACMRHAIGQTMQHAYAHHIQRLMVTGNFMLLAGIDPDDVDRWYLGVYIDALEWVEMPNARGMSQFADGGIVGTKPYAASANYIQKQGDYCKNCTYNYKERTGEAACPLNSLYWDFHARNRDLLEPNPRIGMVYRNWDRKPREEQQSILNRAEEVLRNIESL